MLYHIARLVLKPIYSFFYHIRIEGKENIPKGVPFIACSNHVSAIDPILLGISFPLRVNCIAKAELFKNKFIGFFLKQLGAFPIKRGEPDLKSIKMALKLLSEKNVLGIFPEGTRNKSEDTIAEPGIALLAIKAKVPILPMAIISDYKFFKKTTIKIGKPIFLDSYYDAKLRNEIYSQISFDVMRTIKQLAKE